MFRNVTFQRRGYQACGWTAHRALECAFIGYDLDGCVLAGVEVAAGWRSWYADDTDAPCTEPIKRLECRYSLSRDMRARETCSRARACTAWCTDNTCTKVMSPGRFLGGGRRYLIHAPSKTSGPSCFCEKRFPECCLAIRHVVLQRDENTATLRCSNSPFNW